LAFEGRCSSSLEIEYRNQATDFLLLSVLEVIDEEGKQRALPLKLNVVLPRTKGAVVALDNRRMNEKDHPKRRLFAFITYKVTPPEIALKYVQGLIEGQAPSGVHVRAWSLSPQAE